MSTLSRESLQWLRPVSDTLSGGAQSGQQGPKPLADTLVAAGALDANYVAAGSCQGYMVVEAIDKSHAGGHAGA